MHILSLLGSSNLTGTTKQKINTCHQQ
jgi:hypothetical protein